LKKKARRNEKCYLPRDEYEMLTITGVGENKMKKYGKQFLEVIKDYLRK
jgi:superfamily II DNA helicase RecQ